MWCIHILYSIVHFHHTNKCGCVFSWCLYEILTAAFLLYSIIFFSFHSFSFSDTETSFVRQSTISFVHTVYFIQPSQDHFALWRIISCTYVFDTKKGEKKGIHKKIKIRINIDFIHAHAKIKVNSVTLKFYSLGFHHIFLTRAKLICLRARKTFSRTRISSVARTRDTVHWENR